MQSRKNEPILPENPATSIEQVAEQTSTISPTKNQTSWINKEWLGAGVSTILLILGLAFDHLYPLPWFHHTIRIIWYAVAFVPVGLPVIIRGVKLAVAGELFTEFFLMGIATLGAFFIGEYPEGVTVMLFYTVGELIQGLAVNRAKRNIKSLLDVRPATANVLRNGIYESINPAHVKIGETIQVRAGERVALDGEMLSHDSVMNTAALTGESIPTSFSKGDTILAGMINEGRVIEMSVTKLFEDSALSRILLLVQNAQGRKAGTELFIRRFAKVYTPVVVYLALALTFLPYFFTSEYHFHEWLYRALIFLVISCPCALVVAIPLGYFGGIGAGSRHGILFKGSSYLDRITKTAIVVFDKTGTLTKGELKIHQIIDGEMTSASWISQVAALESQSNHPIAKAIQENSRRLVHDVKNVEEFKGQGLKGTVDGNEIVAGNASLFNKLKIDFPEGVAHHPETTVMVQFNGKFAGYILISDEVKADAAIAVSKLKELGIKSIMLSGDKQETVSKVAATLGIDDAFGNLMPEDKVAKFEAIKKGKTEVVAFVGDGINDAPVLAISDVGIAMGGMGSDAAIETADVVIQTDQPSKIVDAIKIGKATNGIIWQNITLAFAVKFIVLSMGAFGLATMWGAVFADVGVALLAIANAIRIQYMRF